MSTDVLPAVLADLRSGLHRGVVVDSPPGAGKSTLVVRAAAELAAGGDPLIVVAQTNEQVDDLVVRLADAVPDATIGRLAAQDYQAPARIRDRPAVRVGRKLAELPGCGIVIGTAAKWATVGDRVWPWAIVDEAYQMRSDMLLRIANLFDRALFVGDPGQLDPFSTVDIDRWTGLTWDPMQSAVAVLLSHHPTMPVHRLPVSWRLPPTAAPVVARAFYPFAGFEAGTVAGQRHLEFTARASGTASAGPLDATVDLAADRGWALYELPARHAVRTDGQAAAACAELALRVLERGTVAYSERDPAGVPVTADRIAIGAAHRDQVAAIRSVLGTAGDGITVDTANRLQGREYDVTVVLHPLSGRRDASAFHLESGRLCVLASRHRHACLVVARAGIPELLDAHPSTEPVHLNVPVKFPDGWEAHQATMSHLERLRIRAVS
ncbi:AAA family ATPase [Rugosimonospora africana]|uniref:Helicase n=1 Tax=Rugosimonospora africana TaxID=556532 RepID=A0A8J3QZ87_9ACTN|nr:AAA family ATPase [Rugosimonospora africana]GIH18877.1 helicase [Rugosimonospora africana]